MWISYHVVWICSQPAWHWFQRCRRFVREWLGIAICLRAGCCSNLYHTAVFESCNWNKFLDKSKLHQTWRTQWNFEYVMLTLGEAFFFLQKIEFLSCLRKCYTIFVFQNWYRTANCQLEKTKSKCIPIMAFTKPHSNFSYLQSIALLPPMYEVRRQVMFVQLSVC